MLSINLHCRSQVFECGPHRFEYRALAAVESPTDVAPAQGGERTVQVRRRNHVARQRPNQVPGLLRCLVRIDKHACVAETIVVSLAHLRREASDKIEMRSRFQPRAAYDR